VEQVGGHGLLHVAGRDDRESLEASAGQVEGPRAVGVEADLVGEREPPTQLAQGLELRIEPVVVARPRAPAA
jgi:hypothetical protein